MPLSGKPQRLHLTDADGLILFVSGKGAKKWHFRFTWLGKQQRIALGSYPEMPLKAAREERDCLRAQKLPKALTRAFIARNPRSPRWPRLSRRLPTIHFCARKNCLRS